MKQAESLSDTVRRCVDVVKQLRALDAPAARKLTGKAYLRDAMRIADTTLERLRGLQEKLSPYSPFFETKAFIRRAMAAIRSPHWPSPARELRRYNHMLTPEALSEIVMLDSSTFEVFALAVLIATERHPEAFGNCTDIEAYEARIVALTLERDALYEKIERQYTADDLLIAEADKHGKAAVSFKITGSAVPLGPQAGERLVAWMLAQKGNT
jgi:hypothetical protein